MTAEIIERIIQVNGERVLLDRDLAALYGVTTKVLNQAVKRNRGRFPNDFAFRIDRDSVEEARRSRSQSVTLKRGGNLKYRPLVFTEHGALMAASVLNSPRAVEMSVLVVRAFVRLRDAARNHARLAASLADLERRVTGHDHDLRRVISVLRGLVQPGPRSRRAIGFRPRSNA